MNSTVLQKTRWYAHCYAIPRLWHKLRTRSGTGTITRSFEGAREVRRLQFVENYLNTTVEVQDIKYTMPGREVSGITVLKEADVSVCEDGEVIEK